MHKEIILFFFPSPYYYYYYSLLIFILRICVGFLEVLLKKLLKGLEV